MESESAPENAWDRQPDEPTLWFKRFSVYLLMGPTRSLAAAYRDEYARKRGSATTQKEAASNWKVMASRWQWRSRAQAWDSEQLVLASAAIRNKLVALQAHRLDVSMALIDKACAVLNTAHLEEADETQARAWVGEMRMIMVDPCVKILLANSDALSNCSGQL